MRQRIGMIAACTAAALALSGCGNQKSEQSPFISALAQGIGTTVRGGQDSGSGAAAGTPALDRAALEAAGGEYMLAAVPSRGAAALVQKVGSNGAKSTWLSPDGISVTFESGLLVATRGLGPDLMAAQAPGLIAALRHGAGEYTRIHEYLDGNDQIVRQSYVCRVTRAGGETITVVDRSYATVKHEENCTSGGQSFQNLYWQDSSGVTRKSRQLISPPVGYLDSERL